MIINKFQGEHRWLSNFWPCVVHLDGMQFRSVEAAYVAAKTFDPAIRGRLQAMENPADCKRLGRVIPIRKNWDNVKFCVMRDLVRQKFAAGSELANKLIATGDCQIIEGNTWGDTYWGVCNEVGENNLGKIIMDVRADLIKGLTFRLICV